MEVIRKAIIKRHKGHPQLDAIVHDIAEIIQRTDQAWEDGDRTAFSKACRELTRYQPPVPK